MLIISTPQRIGHAQSDVFWTLNGGRDFFFFQEALLRTKAIQYSFKRDAYGDLKTFASA